MDAAAVALLPGTEPGPPGGHMDPATVDGTVEFFVQLLTRMNIEPAHG